MDKKNEKLKRKKDYSKERMALYDKFVEVFNETDGEMPGDEILSAIADFAGVTVAYVSRLAGLDQERVLFAFFDLLVGAAQKAKEECLEEKGS
jgi:hypothetical protein